MSQTMRTESTLGTLALMLVLAIVPGSVCVGADATARPNILWISCEDTSPWLGFCGESYATTPNLDRLASRGVYFTNAFATAPVCSASRFSIITGTYAAAMGTQEHRSRFAVPQAVTGFPAVLRKAGYYCSNNSKTDYNTNAEKRIIDESWDACGGKAHWRGRKPDQPFFAVFNLTQTHQSRAFPNAESRGQAPEQKHDPAKAPIPPYYPDTPEARRTIARVHDCITAMDKEAGRVLSELEQDGLQANTIVFFWPDHGQGIPRGKRTLWDTGTKVPLVVYVPERLRAQSGMPAGRTSDRMISLMDLGPTVLSLLELPVPSYTQGQAFLGKAAREPRQYVFAVRDRIDEVPELSRAVRDSRYLYIRNYMPDLSWNQPESYSDQLPLRREIARLAAAGRLNAPQLTYAGTTKPLEVLYDSEKDPWQLTNLAADPAMRPVLERMRKALHGWQTENRDLGFIHEWQTRKMSGERPPSEAARSDSTYPLERVLDTAGRVGQPGEVREFIRRLSDPDPTVRYWAAMGLRVAGADAIPGRQALDKALTDDSVPVRVEAAGVLVAQFDDRRALDALVTILRSDDEVAAAHAARTLQMLGEKARPVLPVMRDTAAGQGTKLARWCLKEAVARLSRDTETTTKSSDAHPGK